MFGRQVASRLARLPLSARLPFRPAQCPQELIPVIAQRSYASPGRPRKTVGEPSRPVKRAVKRTAKTTDGGPAKKQVKAKKDVAAAKKKTAKPKTAKPKAAAKAAPKKKKLAPKAVTEEQKAAAKAKIAKAKDADLKKAALKPPSNRALSAYNAFMSEKRKGAPGGEMQGANVREKMSALMKGLAAEWRSLSAAELEHYNHLAHTRTEAAHADYKKWVEAHTPEQIKLANRARTALRRRHKDTVKGTMKFTHIRDERAVKRPASSFVQFNTNRQASGDFKNIPLIERISLISKEWKALNESEKMKYKDLQNQDISRYSEEYSSVYGHSPPSHQEHAAAAA